MLRKIINFIAPNYIKELNNSANQRFLEYVKQFDPTESLIKQYFGSFYKEYDRPEDKLDERSKLSLETLGYQLKKDSSFQFLIQWIMDHVGNETLKRAPVTQERSLYGRAQISTMILLRDEVDRLAKKYEERLENNKQHDFDHTVNVE